MRITKQVVNRATGALIACLAACNYAFAAVVPDGKYQMVINVTPEFVPGTGIADVGSDGAWNSTFTFGSLPSVAASKRMTDNGTLVTGSDGVARGSSLAGDGYAGTVEIVVSGTNISVTGMQVDTIFNTAGGNFAQIMPSSFSSMSGTINQTSGAMTFIPTGRLGAISSPSTLYNLPWNIDDVTQPGSTSWVPLTTGSSSNSQGTVNGAAVKSIGDVNGDTLTDYNVILVCASQVGTGWGTFAGASEIETWNVNILSISPRAVNDNSVLTEFTSTPVDVLANDGGKPPLSIVSVSGGTLGTPSIDPGNTLITYTSTGGTGADSFTYTIQDGDGKTASATVNVQVTGSPAVAVDDNAATNQEQAVVINVVANDYTGAAGETIDGTTVSIQSMPANGAVLNHQDGTVTYTPEGGFVGTDTFTYDVMDTAGNLSNTATDQIDVASAALVSAGTYGPGTYALAAGSSNGQIPSSALPVADASAQAYCVGGCYDFVISNAANPTTVVLTQLSDPIPESSVLRVFNGTDWADFDTTAGDAVFSAPLTSGGGCPSIGDPSWEIWGDSNAGSSNIGQQCLSYQLSDNGPNDFDPTLGSIANTSGISAFPAINTSAEKTLNDIKSNGCSMMARPGGHGIRLDLWLVAAFLLYLARARSRPGRP